MIISDVEAIPIRLPLVRPNYTAAGVVTESRKVIVKITTDDGISGFGEASSFPEYGGGTADEAMGAMALYRQHLLGANPFDHARIATRLEELVAGERLARAAINVALHDIVGKSLGQPIYNLYGGKSRHSVDVFIIVAGEDPDMIADDARQAEADGYTVVKVKAGFEPIEATIAKIGAIRQAVGSNLDITVDANQAWGVKEAIANIERMEPFNLQSVEQPVAAQDIEGMKTVTAAIDIPIIADESIWDIKDALRLIGVRGADVLSVRVSKAGGISNAHAILEVAHGAGMPCILGSMLETDLGISAALQLAASVNCKLQASALSHYQMYGASLLERPLRQEGAALQIPIGPGLGVEVSEKAINQYRESP